MEEFRIDLSKVTEDERNILVKEAKTLFLLNQTMPFTNEYEYKLNELFGDTGENFNLRTPLQGVRFSNVKIGKNVAIMSNCLMMAAGGIIIDDDVMIAANVQLISNNHDLDNRKVITCKPVHIKKNCWIGAGATVLAGITIGENSVVGAGSVVTKDVPDNVIVAGNPARIIKQI